MPIREVTGYLWMAFALYWFIAAALVKRAVRRQSARSRILQALGTIAGFVLIFDDRIKWGPLDQQIIPASPAFEDLGLVLTTLGLLFAVWARIYLGGNWSGAVTLKQDHTLIRTGPYALVRHPIYTGILLAALGTVVSIGKLRCFLGFVLLGAVLRVKSRLEERFMHEQFGPQYASYMRDVRALVPFIW